MSTIRHLSVRRLLIVLALLISAIAPAASMSAAPVPTASMSAAPAPVVPMGVQPDYAYYHYEYTYYWDSTKTNEVGYATRDCNGHYVLWWGMETAYYRIVRDSCTA